MEGDSLIRGQSTQILACTEEPRMGVLCP